VALEEELMRFLAPALPAALAVVTLVAGCTGSAEPPSSSAERGAEAGVPTTATPGAALTLVADADPVSSSLSTSRALYQRSPVAVVAGDGDLAAQLLGAAAAVGLGVPLLLAPAGSGSAGPLDAELDRLGATSVLSVGDVVVDARPGEDGEVVAVPADAAAVERATGLEFAAGAPVAEEGAVAAVAALDREQPVALRPSVAVPPASTPAAGSPAPPARTTVHRLPRVDRAAPLADALVLATGAPGSLAGVATARAAGARVELTNGVADPRASSGVIEALAADPAPHVVALGAAFGAEPGLDWKLATAATGAQLPGGGQLLFPQRMLVALYGIPGSGALGVLGEQDLPASIQRARDTAAPYRDLVGVTVVPAFEIIATVASAFPGPDGNYSAEGDIETLRPWVEAAGAAGMYVVLDLQPGRTDFLSQAKAYQPLLELPYVGLALDPEWRLRPGEVHLTQIGQVGVDEINQVVTWLADLTRDHRLPQKLFVVHQFQVRMVIDRERLDTSRDELAMMVHVDGQGGQSAKQDTWRVLRQDAPAPLYWGWKNFVDEDSPMLTPQQTIEQVVPTPQLVTYQ
jgi:hypothetical protein